MGRKAVTLIELLITMAIIAILTVVALPYYLGCVARIREMAGG